MESSKLNKEFYDIKVLKQNREEVDLHEYEGKVLLIVNTATGCGFTPQYEKLEKLYKENKDKGFEILDFPCNQFREQAKGTDEEINQFCTLKYNTTFPRYRKIEVNGQNETQLFKYLKSHAPNKGAGFIMTMLKWFSGAKDNDIKWNFTKFLVDKNGNVIDRFEPVDDIDSVVVKRVEEALK